MEIGFSCSYLPFISVCFVAGSFIFLIGCPYSHLPSALQLSFLLLRSSQKAEKEAQRRPQPLATFLGVSRLRALLRKGHHQL